MSSQTRQQNMLALAISIAANAHLHKVDFSGMAYICHPLRVMNYLKEYSSDTSDDLKIVAVLHDTIEDSDVTLEQLRLHGFNYRVIFALSLLTHDKLINYDDYINAIVNSNNIDAICVKLADLTDNSNIMRLKGIGESDSLRIIKYHKAYMLLSEKLSELKASNTK